MRIVFENPWMLAYLVSIPFLIVTHFVFMRFNKRRAMRFANFETLKRVTGEKLLTRNILVLILRCILLLCLVLAAAGAELWVMGQRNTNDFVLAIDSSASMSTGDFDPNRLEASKDAALTFVDRLDSRSKMGIVGFSSSATVDLVPSIDREKVKSEIEGLQIQKTGSTNIGQALVTSTNLLLGSEDQGKAIILITDGSNTVRGRSLESGINYVKEHHVVVHSIGVGTEEGLIGYLPENLSISSLFDQDLLQNISLESGGQFFSVNESQALDEAFAEISSESTESFINYDLRPSLLLIGLLVFFLEWGLVNTRFGRLA